MLAAKDPSSYPECACAEESTPVSGVGPPTSTGNLAPSSPARPATLPPSPPTVL